MTNIARLCYTRRKLPYSTLLVVKAVRLLTVIKILFSVLLLTNRDTLGDLGGITASGVTYFSSNAEMTAWLVT
jgi:hypothetical protein